MVAVYTFTLNWRYNIIVDFRFMKFALEKIPSYGRRLVSLLVTFNTSFLAARNTFSTNVSPTLKKTS